MHSFHDDESILSGIYTESGDASVAHNTLFDLDDDDEMFRRAVQAEQGRVMREFGVVLPSNSDETSVDSSSDSSEGRDKTTSTPETYDEAYTVENGGGEEDGKDDGDASTFHPNTLFPSASHEDSTMKQQPDPILTPRRLKMIMVVLCVIFVASIAVATGSFLAQKESESSSTPQQAAQVDADVDTDVDKDTDAPVPDTVSLITTTPADSPSASPSTSLHWKQGDECVDHPTQTFLVNERDGEQDCAFLRTNLDQRARLCLLEKEGYRWCPVTCGLCLQTPNIAPSISPTPGVDGEPVTTSSPLVDTRPPTVAPTTMVPTANPTFVATEAPTPEPTAAETMLPTPAATVAATAAATTMPTIAATILATAAPTIEATSSYFCQACPFKICEILPCD